MTSHVVGPVRDGQQQRLLHGGEVVAGPLAGRAVDPPSGHVCAPPLCSSLGVGRRGEVLPGEERPLDVMHGPFHPRLVLGLSDPRRVDGEPTDLGVLHYRAVDPRVGGGGLVDDRLGVVGDQAAKTPLKNTQAAYRQAHCDNLNPARVGIGQLAGHRGNQARH